MGGQTRGDGGKGEGDGTQAGEGEGGEGGGRGEEGFDEGCGGCGGEEAVPNMGRWIEASDQSDDELDAMFQGLHLPTEEEEVELLRLSKGKEHLSVLEPRVSHAEYCIPGLFALASFVFAWVGPRKLYGSERSERRLQDPLIH